MGELKIGELSGHNDLKEDEKELFNMIPETGESIGNKNLREKLGWSEEKYWSARNSLVEKSYIQTGMGRGGSVYRIRDITTSVAEEEDSVSSESYKSELELYDPFMESLATWSKEVNLSNYFIEKTANQGSRKTGGMWTRPDIVIINVESYQFVPNKFLEITTFEIKPASGWEISAVFETAAHSRFSTQSYLAIHKDISNPPSEDLIERIRSECVRFEIGFIVFTEPERYETFEFLVDPIRKQPDPREVDKFIEKQINEMNKSRLSRWLR